MTDYKYSVYPYYIIYYTSKNYLILQTKFVNIKLSYNCSNKCLIWNIYLKPARPQVMDISTMVWSYTNKTLNLGENSKKDKPVLFQYDPSHFKVYIV